MCHYAEKYVMTAVLKELDVVTDMYLSTGGARKSEWLLEWGWGPLARFQVLTG